MVCGYLSLLCSISDKPLEYWSKQQPHTGCIRRTLDPDLSENVVELRDSEQSNIAGTSITCPFRSQELLDIKLSFLVMVIKNMDSIFRFQIQVTDSDKVRYHFKFSNEEVLEKNPKVQSSTIHSVGLKLQSGWNTLELDLRRLMQTAFRVNYGATQKLRIASNSRLRRVYFVDRHYTNFELSSELFRDFFDSYMSKWGIYLVERATQTTKSFVRKVKCDKRQVLPSPNTANDPDLDEVSSAAAKEHALCSANGRMMRKSSPAFLERIQHTTGKLIDDFFARRDLKQSSLLNVKGAIETKSYVIPIPKEHRQESPDTSNDGLLDTSGKRSDDKDSFIASANRGDRNDGEQRKRHAQAEWNSRYSFQEKM